MKGTKDAAPLSKVKYHRSRFLTPFASGERTGFGMTWSDLKVVKWVGKSGRKLWKARGRVPDYGDAG